MARRAGHLWRALHLLRRSKAARGEFARQVRRPGDAAHRRFRGVAGERVAETGSAPLPYRKSAETPNLAVLDSSDDIRGGMGIDGLAKLVEFVQQGGLLITEGSTATIFPEYGITSGVSVEEPAQLFARGSILRATIADAKSPIAYGYTAEVPVYFNQGPVLNAGGNRGAATGGVGRWRIWPEHHAQCHAVENHAIRAGAGR